MMLGNRGETRGDLRRDARVPRARAPHQYIFSCLSVYPGTRDFDDAEKAGWLDREVYFTGDFQELKTPFDASTRGHRAHERLVRARTAGLREHYRESVARVPRRSSSALGDYHAAHMDLAGALYHEGARRGRAARAARARARLPAARPRATTTSRASPRRAATSTAMMDHFRRAAKADPQH